MQSQQDLRRYQKISEDTRRKIEGHKIEINIPVAFIWNSSCLWDVYESLTFFDHSNHRKHSNHQELGQRLVDGDWTIAPYQMCHGGAAVGTYSTGPSKSLRILKVESLMTRCNDLEVEILIQIKHYKTLNYIKRLKPIKTD